MEALEPITKTQKNTLKNKADYLYWFDGLEGVNKITLTNLQTWIKQIDNKWLASNILSAWYSLQLPNTPNQECNINNLAAFLYICKNLKTTDNLINQEQL